MDRLRRPREFRQVAREIEWRARILRAQLGCASEGRLRLLGLVEGSVADAQVEMALDVGRPKSNRLVVVLLLLCVLPQRAEHTCAAEALVGCRHADAGGSRVWRASAINATASRVIMISVGVRT